MLAIKDNGTIDRWDFYNTNWKESVIPFAEYITPYLRITNNCGSQTGCLEGTPVFLLNGEYQGTYDTNPAYYKMVLDDGSFMWFRVGYGGSKACASTEEKTENICAAFWVDVNGARKPNRVGHDVFHFKMLKDRVVPGNSYDCNKKSAGWGCSSHVIRFENMKYPD